MIGCTSAQLDGLVRKNAAPQHKSAAGRFQVTQRLLARVAIGLGLLALPALASAQAAPPPPAEPASAVGDFLKSFKFKHPPVTPKDFVVNSRAASPRHDFMPVESTPPDHDIKVKSAAEIASTTAALDAMRGHHDSLTGRRPRALVKAKKPPKAALAPGNSGARAN